MKYLQIVTVLFSVLCLHSHHVESARILSVEFFGSKSHVLTYLPLLEELARKGHQITLISPSKGLSKEKNIKEIFTFSIETAVYENENEPKKKDKPLNFFEMKEQNVTPNPFGRLTTIVPKLCRKVYDDPQVKAVMEEDWDLILFQPMFNDCALGLVYRVHSKNTPLVLFTPAQAPSWIVTRTGGHHPYSFVPSMFSGYTDKMNFYQRFMNFGINHVMDVVMGLLYMPTMEAVYRDALGQDIPSADSILRNASLIISNSHFSLSRLKPNLPDVVEVGGILSRPAKPLPKDLEDFIAKGGENGFILFSLGSSLRSDQMSDAKRKMFRNVFSKLKQQVIWKFETETMEDLPKNVKLSKWLPQQDILGHPKIKLFITHCGMGGTEEAIYHEVPLLGMPFYGDQSKNANEAQNHGFLHQVDWNLLTEEYLTNAINEVLNNPKYKENVQRISRVFKDQIDDPLKRGVWWMEYVLRHKGAPQLRSPARELNYFQYHSYDVIAAYAAIFFAIFYVLYSIVTFVLRKCGLIGKASTAKQNSSKNSKSDKTKKFN